MIENFKNVIFNNYANFEGRASRREFWLFSLVNFFVFIICFAAILYGSVYNTYVVIAAAYVFSILYSLVLWTPCIALWVRRLHDINISGLWILITFIPFIGSIVLFVFSVPWHRG